VKRRLYLPAGAAAAVLLALAALAAVALASPAQNVTPTLLARGTYDGFKVKSDPDGLIEFEAEAKPAIDIVVRRHDYVPSTTVPVPTTGWHSHPGPVFITVTLGQLTYSSTTIRTARHKSCRQVKGSSTAGADTSCGTSPGSPPRT
jgi:hypothetical protein